MVVDAFTGHRVVAVALGFGAKWSDHLRMAANAALADIYVAAFQLQCGVGLEAGHRLVGDVLEEQRHDLHEAADAHGQHHHQGHQADVLLEYFVSHQWAPSTENCAAACSSAALLWRTVCQTFQAISSMPLKKIAPPITRTTKPGWLASSASTKE
ncbi:hypothetical protein FQZ97_1089980 [compost metagenome]